MDRGLDEHYPPCGPCAICGFHDKRHRLWDTILDEYHHGQMTPTEIANEYKLTIEHVAAVITEKPYRDDLTRRTVHWMDEQIVLLNESKRENE